MKTKINKNRKVLQRTLAPILIVASLFTSSSELFAKPKSKPAKISLHGGYAMDVLTTGLDFPTSITFAGDRTWIAEAGILMLPPKIKEIDAHGNARVILDDSMLPAGRLLFPINDITWHRGFIYLSHRQMGVNGWMVGAISRFRPDHPAASFTTIITGLPSSGDHHTDDIVFDRSGRLYFSQGTASNSGLVGADNEVLEGWLAKFPTFHDFPAKEVVLSGASYQTVFPFSLDPAASAITAPFSVFGSGPAAPGTIVPAATPMNPQKGIIAGVGAVYSFDPAAANPLSTWRLEAWGMRNPFGLGIDPFNPRTLFVSNAGCDTRSKIVDGELRAIEPRPIKNDHEDVFRIHIGGEEEFFGWPDYFHDPSTGQVLPVTDPLFCEPGEQPIPCPDFLLASAFRQTLRVQPAFAQLENHSSAVKFDFSVDRRFKFVGDIFLAESGSYVPQTGAMEFTGRKVVRIDRRTGRSTDFFANTGETMDEIFDPEGLNQPLDVKFHEGVMFVVDLGIFEPGLGLMQPGTGKIWTIVRGKGPRRGLDKWPSSGRDKWPSSGRDKGPRRGWK